MGIVKFLFRRRQSSSVTHVSSAIYDFLWVVALLSVAGSYLSILIAQPSLLVLVFGCSATALQFMVYRDLKKIEGNERTIAEQDYPEWIDANLELILRWIILGALLLGVGKVFEVIYPLVANGLIILPKIATAWFPAFEVPFRLPSPPLSNEHSMKVFLFGSASAFLFLAVWNFFAIILRIRHSMQGWRSWDIRTRFDDLAVTVRVLLFLLASVLACGYWVLSFVREEFVLDWTHFFILVFFCTVAGFFLLRSPRVKGSLVALLVSLVT